MHCTLSKQAKIWRDALKEGQVVVERTQTAQLILALSQLFILSFSASERDVFKICL